MYKLSLISINKESYLRGLLETTLVLKEITPAPTLG